MRKEMVDQLKKDCSIEDLELDVDVLDLVGAAVDEVTMTEKKEKNHHQVLLKMGKDKPKPSLLKCDECQIMFRNNQEKNDHVQKKHVNKIDNMISPVRQNVTAKAKSSNSPTSAKQNGKVEAATIKDKVIAKNITQATMPNNENVETKKSNTTEKAHGSTAVQRKIETINKEKDQTPKGLVSGIKQTEPMNKSKIQATATKNSPAGTTTNQENIQGKNEHVQKKPVDKINMISSVWENGGTNAKTTKNVSTINSPTSVKKIVNPESTIKSATPIAQATTPRTEVKKSNTAEKQTDSIAVPKKIEAMNKEKNVLESAMKETGTDKSTGNTPASAIKNCPVGSTTNHEQATSPKTSPAKRPPASILKKSTYDTIEKANVNTTEKTQGPTINKKNDNVSNKEDVKETKNVPGETAADSAEKKENVTKPTSDNTPRSSGRAKTNISYSEEEEDVKKVKKENSPTTKNISVSAKKSEVSISKSKKKVEAKLTPAAKNDKSKKPIEDSTPRAKRKINYAEDEKEETSRTKKSDAKQSVATIKKSQPKEKKANLKTPGSSAKKVKSNETTDTPRSSGRSRRTISYAEVEAVEREVEREGKKTGKVEKKQATPARKKRRTVKHEISEHDDEIEYAPKTRERDEARVRSEKELAARRAQRELEVCHQRPQPCTLYVDTLTLFSQAAKKALEKSGKKPQTKKPKTDSVVEAIKGKKVVEGNTWYQVLRPVAAPAFICNSYSCHTPGEMGGLFKDDLGA